PSLGHDADQNRVGERDRAGATWAPEHRAGQRRAADGWSSARHTGNRRHSSISRRVPGRRPARFAYCAHGAGGAQRTGAVGAGPGHRAPLITVFLSPASPNIAAFISLLYIRTHEAVFHPFYNGLCNDRWCAGAEVLSVAHRRW